MRKRIMVDQPLGLEGGGNLKLPLLRGVGTMHNRPPAPFNIVDQDIYTPELLYCLIYQGSNL
jgi:hypothetical protein